MLRLVTLTKQWYCGPLDYALILVYTRHMNEHQLFPDHCKQLEELSPNVRDIFWYWDSGIKRVVATTKLEDNIRKRIKKYKKED